MAKTKYVNPERRKYLRLPSRCAVKHTKLSKNLRPIVNLIIKSYTKDMCATGISFVVRKKIPLHTIVEFQFKISGINRSIAGLGEVVRIKPRAGGRSCDVGLKFLWIRRKNADLIDTYVRKKRIQKIIKKL